jgi:hypothetical protein
MSDIDLDFDPLRHVDLTNRERSSLRDWFDTSGPYPWRMNALYRLVRRVARNRARLAWEQGWVARGNEWDVTDNPYEGRSRNRRQP